MSVIAFLASASDFLTGVGGPIGGGGAVGAVAGFVGWVFRESIRWTLARPRGDDADEGGDRLGLFVAVGGGVGGLCGFLIWLYDTQGLI